MGFPTLSTMEMGRPTYFGSKQLARGTTSNQMVPTISSLSTFRVRDSHTRKELGIPSSWQIRLACYELVVPAEYQPEEDSEGCAHSQAPPGLGRLIR
jgi:hypothetical protein